MVKLRHIKLYENFITDEKDVKTILNSYLECALFTDSDELVKEYYSNTGNVYGDTTQDISELIGDVSFEIEDFSDDAKIRSYQDIKRFLSLAGDLVGSIDESDIGHDLWLSRNGHGSGFFDRDYISQDVLDELQEIASSLGSVSLYLDDENKIIIE